MQALHQSATVHPSAPTADFSHIPTPVIQPATAERIAADSHTTVKRDLVVLVPLLLGMMVLLFAAKWATDNTALTQWILGAGKLFS